MTSWLCPLFPPEYLLHMFNFMGRYKGAFGGLPNKNCIHEQMLPKHLDLVIWGHEHDCILSSDESEQVSQRIIITCYFVLTCLNEFPKFYPWLKIPNRVYAMASLHAIGQFPCHSTWFFSGNIIFPWRSITEACSITRNPARYISINIYSIKKCSTIGV